MHPETFSHFRLSAGPDFVSRKEKKEGETEEGNFLLDHGGHYVFVDTNDKAWKNSVWYGKWSGDLDSITIEYPSFQVEGEPTLSAPHVPKSRFDREDVL